MKKGGWICHWVGCPRQNGASYGQRHALVSHLRTHTLAKPYKCESCGARFGRSDGLSKHKARCGSQSARAPAAKAKVVKKESRPAQVEVKGSSDVVHSMGWEQKYEMVKARLRYILKETEGMTIVSIYFCKLIYVRNTMI